MSFNNSLHQHKLKNKETSKLKTQQVLLCSDLSDVGIYLRNRPFSSDIEIGNLHPPRGTHWVAYLNESFFDSYGCVCSKILFILIIKRYGYCLYSEYKKQGD